MLIDDIKRDQLQARMQKDEVRASLLTTLLGEVQTASKSGKSLADADVLAVIKKFIKNLESVMEVAPSEKVSREIELLTKYTPAQLSEEQLVLLLTELKSSGAAGNLGEAMKILKTDHPGRYDGALASKVARNIFVS